MAPETYLGFHLRFLLPPILVLGLLAARRHDASRRRGRRFGLAVIVAFALVYTTPWDSFLIRRGVWWYGDGVVTARLWSIPIGEFLFFVLQPVLVALWLDTLDVPTGGSLHLSPRVRLVGLLGGVVVGAVGIGCLLAAPSTLYLGAILVWAAPVLAIQWAFGWPQLFAARRAVALGIAVPTIYLWLTDRYAIANGLWTISPTHTLGVAPFGLPIEEAIFFLVTNVFIVQGLVLYRWLFERWSTIGPAGTEGVLPTVSSLLPASERPPGSERFSVDERSASRESDRGRR